VRGEEKRPTSWRTSNKAARFAVNSAVNPAAIAYFGHFLHMAQELHAMRPSELRMWSRRGQSN
jgi:hypothetical protein